MGPGRSKKETGKRRNTARPTEEVVNLLQLEHFAFRLLLLPLHGLCGKIVPGGSKRPVWITDWEPCTYEGTLPDETCLGIRYK